MWKEKRRFLGTEIYCILTNPMFYVSVFIVAVMCFTAPLYYDALKDEDETVFYVLISRTRAQLLEDTELSFLAALRAGSGSWLTMFAPIISALSFVPMCQDRKKSGAMRFQISRVGENGYLQCTLLAGFINGALAFLAGYMLYTGVVAFCFPMYDEYEETLQSLLTDTVSLGYSMKLYDDNGIYTLGIIFVEWMAFAIYGGFYGMCTTFCLNFSDNSYLTLCVPFFIKYCLKQFWNKLCYADFNSSEFADLYMKLLRMTNPDALLEIFSRRYPWVLTLLFFTALALGMYALERLLYNRREDCGR